MTSQDGPIAAKENLLVYLVQTMMCLDVSAMACLALRQASRTCQEATFVCVSSAGGCDAVL